jgi:Na+-driven multidrug efflux pump
MDVSIPRIIRFAVPAVGIWLCNPLLSVIDTSTVGMLRGKVQQAALHPAVAVTDYSARLMEGP